MLTATAYDTHVEQLFDRMRQLHTILTEAGIPYRIVGGMAVFLHVFERDPIRARLTADVDAAIDRSQLPAVIEAVSKIGWEFRHVKGIDILVETTSPRVRSSVHLFPNTTASPTDKTDDGFILAPVIDLIRMKLTSYRLKDQVHIQDLDGVGLITPEIEAQLPAALLKRLAEIRARE